MFSLSGYRALKLQLVFGKNFELFSIAMLDFGHRSFVTDLCVGW